MEIGVTAHRHRAVAGAGDDMLERDMVHEKEFNHLLGESVELLCWGFSFVIDLPGGAQCPGVSHSRRLGMRRSLGVSIMIC